jgi:hypothetical protein
MKLFEDSQGFIIAFGFDMREQKPHSRMICWCDPETKVWETTAANQAGWLTVPTTMIVAPEFVFENLDRAVVAYQPGLCIELRRLGRPYVFALHILHAR